MSPNGQAQFDPTGKLQMTFKNFSELLVICLLKLFPRKLYILCCWHNKSSKTNFLFFSSRTKLFFRVKVHPGALCCLQEDDTFYLSHPGAKTFCNQARANDASESLESVPKPPLPNSLTTDEKKIRPQVCQEIIS